MLLPRDGTAQTQLRQIPEALVVVSYRISLKAGQELHCGRFSWKPRNQLADETIRNAFTGCGLTQQLEKESCSVREQSIWGEVAVTGEG